MRRIFVKLLMTLTVVWVGVVTMSARAYEINNHADMSERAARMSFPEVIGFPNLKKQCAMRRISIGSLVV